MDLFTPIVPAERQHPIFRMLLATDNTPERAVLTEWATGFQDRDGKFVQEFQTTFESSFWELYLHATLKALGLTVDGAFASPDFVVTAPTPLVLEATIASPAQGGALAFGADPPQLPGDLNEFNRQAIVRLCNSFTAKAKRYREYYATLPQAKERPFVIAIAPFDRPQAHLAANRPIIAALYGVYFDEEATIAGQTDAVVNYDIDAVPKHATADVPVGFFTNPDYAEVSAVIYGPLATWGKLRALADAPDKGIWFTTLHPSSSELIPQIRKTPKSVYVEHLLDGLYVLHNPFAAHPLTPEVFAHERLAQFLVRGDGTVEEVGPDDFLLMRSLITLSSRDEVDRAQGRG
ncbi:MAG: glycosaminoglycan attachment site [Gammaproteobacteria bacterium RIFCSPHIGHO2_12_FULL_63_22]|nr:MAG: glycosaminoglycan attachment site [Gammaproteobacteria bacterium RIFCSPHIGHO2_12_FULL_63_22]